MFYSVAQHRSSLLRNSAKRCSCQCHVDGAPPAPTKRGSKHVAGTAHGTLHDGSCPHSELIVTAFQLNSPAMRRAKRIAAEMANKRAGRKYK